MVRRAMLGLLLLGHAVASSGADLGDCAAIADDVVRLFCYDRLAGRVPPSPATEPVKVPAPTQIPTSPPLAAQTPAPASTPAAEPVADPKRIEARIAGRFEGWSTGTKFVLDNGQVWEAVGASSHYSKSDSPKVVIERDFIGQHLMSVEGVKSRALVRRVEP